MTRVKCDFDFLPNVFSANSLKNQLEIGNIFDYTAQLASVEK